MPGPMCTRTLRYIVRTKPTVNVVEQRTAFCASIGYARPPLLYPAQLSPTPTIIPKCSVDSLTPSVSFARGLLPARLWRVPAKEDVATDTDYITATAYAGESTHKPSIYTGGAGGSSVIPRGIRRASVATVWATKHLGQWASAWKAIVTRVLGRQTSARAEVQAAIGLLRITPPQRPVTWESDAKYGVRGIEATHQQRGKYCVGVERDPWSALRRTIDLKQAATTCAHVPADQDAQRFGPTMSE